MSPASGSAPGESPTIVPRPASPPSESCRRHDLRGSEASRTQPWQAITHPQIAWPRVALSETLDDVVLIPRLALIALPGPVIEE